MTLIWMENLLPSKCISANLETWRFPSPELCEGGSRSMQGSRAECRFWQTAIPFIQEAERMHWNIWTVQIWMDLIPLQPDARSSSVTGCARNRWSRSSGCKRRILQNCTDRTCDHGCGYLYQLKPLQRPWSNGLRRCTEKYRYGMRKPRRKDAAASTCQW